jgi:N-acetylmuramoyl-L-alanine amidase
MRAKMRTITSLACAFLILGFAVSASAQQGLTVRGVRYFSYPNFTRIVFETADAAPYVLTRSSDGKTIYFSSYGGPFTLTTTQLPAIHDGVVQYLEIRQDRDQRAVIIYLGTSAGTIKDFVLRGPDRIVVDIFRGAAPAIAPSSPEVLVPVVVLDPGHGGADTGVTSSHGSEKAFTLELAKAVRRALRKSSPKIKILLTREQDRSVPADDRAAQSNAKGVSLFVSLHGAPGRDCRALILDPDEGQLATASGVSGDFLGFDAMSGQHQTLWGSQQATHAEESGRLGRALVRALTGLNTAEPVQAPVALLAAVDAAATLIEVGTDLSQTTVAEAITRGIEHYVNQKR